MTRLFLAIVVLLAATSRPAQEPTSYLGAGESLALAGTPHSRWGVPPFPAAVNVTASEGTVPTTSMPGALTIRGWATYCAPTPEYCQRWGGDARLGAVPSFRYGDEPYTVTVWYGERSTTVTVVSFCGCGERSGVPTVIDLSPAAFADLAPLSTGRIRVTLVPARGAPDAPAFTLPPTSTLPEETP